VGSFAWRVGEMGARWEWNGWELRSPACAHARQHEDASVLSRRDEMKVARHGMPGMCHPKGRPVGYGMIGWREGGCCLGWWTKRGAADHIRLGGDGSLLPFTRHFMPGYPRFIPPGQRLVSSCWRACASAGRRFAGSSSHSRFAA